MIKNNKNISGIGIGEKNHKLSQFADDTSLILDGSEKSFNEALQVLDTFGQRSGLKINNDKTNVIWIGSQKFSKDVYHHRWKLVWGKTKFTLLGIDFSINLDEISNMNYDNAINTIDKNIVQWSKRVLTPIGRIVVIKSILLPKLNHLFMSIPNPNIDKINTLNKNFFHFVWQSSIDRIKRDTLIKNYEDGGLKMIDLQKFIISLKSTWLRRLIVAEEKEWISIFETEHFKISKFIDVGSDFLKKVKTNNKFWENVFQAWSNISDSDFITTLEEFIKSPVWYNPLLKIDNVSFFNKEWHEKGIKFISDFMDSNQMFLNFESFKQKFNLESSNFLFYRGICESIKTALRSNQIEKGKNFDITRPFIPNHINILIKNKKGCKDMYNSLINSVQNTNTAELKWTSNLNIDIENWKQVCENTFKLSKDTTIQWFQYRLQHRILPVNTYLKNIGIKNCNKCNICKTEIESIQHLFWECDEIKRIWQMLIEWIQNKINKTIQLNLTSILFGNSENLQTSYPLNFIILHTKYSIYCSSRKNDKITLNEIKNFLLYRFNIEKTLAQKNMTIDKFNKLWENWQNIFS